MKILFYTDTHFHDYTEFYHITEKGYSNRIDLEIKSLKYVFDYAVKNKITNCIHGGDLYQFPKTVNTVISSLVSEVYHNDKYKSLKHHYIMGSHDVVDKKSKI